MWQRAKLLTCLLCAGAVIVWLAVEAVPAQNQPPIADAADAAPGMASLLAEVRELRERVTQLEERLSQLEGGIQPLEYRFTPDFGAIPPARPAPRVPERTPHGEINGIPYYIIPLSNE